MEQLHGSCREQLRQQHSHTAQCVHAENPGKETPTAPRGLLTELRPGFCALGSNPHFKPHISGTQVPSELVAQIRERLGHPAAMGGVLGKSQQMEIWYLQMLIFSCLLSFFGVFLKQVCLSPHPSTHYPHPLALHPFFCYLLPTSTAVI